MNFKHQDQLSADPKLASFELKVIRVLQTYGPTKNVDLWYRSGASTVGREAFNSCLDHLVEQKLIVRELTHRVNRQIYRMPPDARRAARAAKREAAKREAAAPPAPLTPEAA